MAEAKTTRSEAIAALTKSGERYELQQSEIDGVPVLRMASGKILERQLRDEAIAAMATSTDGRQASA